MTRVTLRPEIDWLITDSFLKSRWLVASSINRMLGLPVKRAGNQNTLLSAPGNPQAQLTNDGFIAHRHGHNFSSCNAAALGGHSTTKSTIGAIFKTADIIDKRPGKEAVPLQGAGRWSGSLFRPIFWISNWRSIVAAGGRRAARTSLSIAWSYQTPDGPTSATDSPAQR